MICVAGRSGILPADGNVAFHEASALERLFNRLQHIGRLERLEMVVESPVLRSFDGGFHSPFAGHNDHRQLGMPLSDLLESFQAAHTGHADIENHQIELFGLDVFQRHLGAVGRHDYVSFCAKYFRKPGEHISLVVNYQDSAHGILTLLSESRLQTPFPARLMIQGRGVRRASP